MTDAARRDSPDAQPAPARDVRYAGYERHTTADGVELAYRLQGEGPALTLVNSTLETSTAWRAFAHRGSKRWRILTYDLRNQGRSGGGEPSFARHVADLESLLAALGVERTVLLGHSIGTQICVEFAARRPELVDGLVLVGPMVNPSGAERRRQIARGWRQVLEHGGLSELFDVFWPQILCDRTYAQAGERGHDAYREIWLATTRADQLAATIDSCLDAQGSRPPLEAVECPTLLLAGEDDFLGTEGALREAEALLEDGRSRRLRDVGHVPQLEAPQAFAREVETFMAQVARASGA